jgi:hypothetical protein
MRLTDFFSESANGGNDTFSAFDTVTVVLKGGRRFDSVTVARQVDYQMEKAGATGNTTDSHAARHR